MLVVIYVVEFHWFNNTQNAWNISDIFSWRCLEKTVLKWFYFSKNFTNIWALNLQILFEKYVKWDKTICVLQGYFI